MGILYLMIFIIVFVTVLCLKNLDYIALFLGIVIAVPAAFWIIIPHYSYNTEIIETKNYSLVALNEIDDKRFADENTYLIYDSINDDFIYYYKDEKEVIRQNSISASSEFVSVIRSNSVTTLDINKRDYSSKALKHLLLNSFYTEYVLTIPENSEICQLYPVFMG